MKNEERINVLENQVRTLKRIVCGFGCLLTVGVVVGTTSMQKVPDVIEAKTFRVVNDDGLGLVILSSMQVEGRDYGYWRTLQCSSYVPFCKGDGDY